jgi:hypothetical protein
MNQPAPIDPEIVQDFVGSAHGDLARVQALLSDHPNLANAAWDWGGGDWETGLGAAAHMGRRDIALFLLASGARLDVFAAAMLGYVDVVAAALAERPDTASTPGPHGIALIDHARAGGPEAGAVLELLAGASLEA